MTSEERRAAARARVKAWKEAHPKSVFWQRQRRYARQKAAKQAASRGVLVELVVREKLAARAVQETWYEDLEGVDVGYDGRGTGAVAGVSGRATGVMEAEKGFGRRIRDDPGEDAGGGGAGATEFTATVEERRVQEWLARKRAPGVEVELEL